MDHNGPPFAVQKLRNSEVEKKESEKGMPRFRRRHWDLGTESSLDCSSSSSDTDGEISKLREENRRLRKLAKHYRRKYLNAKERFRDVSSLNVELQKRLFEMSPLQAVSYETPPLSMTYPMVHQQTEGQPYAMPQEELLHHPQRGNAESPPTYDHEEEDLEEKEYKEHNMFMEYVPAQEPLCELSHDDGSVSEQILSEDKLRTASCVRSGQAGDSLFVKNLALAIWGAKTLAARSVTGKRCMAIKHSVAKPPLSPKKVEYIKEKFIERIRQHEPHCSMLELSRRVGKIRVYIADKIATLNRRST